MTIRVLGVMTGTSCDGLDASCLEVDEGGWRSLWNESSPYPQALRKKVLEIQKPGAKTSLKDLLALNRDLGEWYGQIIRKMIQNAPVEARPELIANHGQTVAHHPGKRFSGVTLQLGDPTRIARATGLTVISNFREGDVAVGGQGAPLVPLFHKMLATQLSEGRGGIAIHNIGGISNLTYIGPNGETLAFDTGPGNAWIDAAAEKASRGKLKMDRGGKLAIQGEIDWKGMEKVLKNRYFKAAPPKSTGRDDFPFSMLTRSTSAKGPSLVATATAVTVESIARAYEEHVLSRELPLEAIFVCGGGARNVALMTGLQQRMGEVEVLSLAEAGIDPAFIEAQAFALFGFFALIGHPIGGSWTGATDFGPPGHIIPGKNWPEIVRKGAALTASLE